jgi:RHS repeat-associated protein
VQYNPSGTNWSYTVHSGVAGNGSNLTNRNPNAPDGSQVGFIQNDGVISQIWNASAGTYTLSFQAAQSRSVNLINQRMQVTLRPSVGGVTTKTFVWCGTQICEERDASGATVRKRFFAEGEQRIGGSDSGSYFYTRDHLGSIREVTDSGGGVVAQYDYDAYGNRLVVRGKMDADFGYTGDYYHAPSGLNLALYRAYNPALGRWISRDPIGEAGGINLYGYVGNDPTNRLDPLGLFQITIGGGYGWGALNTFGYNSGHVNFGGFVGLAEGFFGEVDTEDSTCSGSGFNAGVRVHAEAGAKFLKGRKQIGCSGDSGGAFMESGGPDPSLNINWGGRPFNFGPTGGTGTFGGGLGAVIGLGASWTSGP